MKRGVSILEVMFAILICTIGLLGAIAIFPVASSMARKGKIADMSSVAGISAVHDFDVRGMRNPSNWVLYSGGTWSPVTLAPGQAYFIDAGYMSGIVGKTATLSGQNDDATLFPYYNLSAGTNIDATSQRRMNRITLKASSASTASPPVPMSGLQAETIFAVADDLAYNRPEDRSKAAEQMYVRSKDETATLKRSNQDTLSWAATLAPKVDYIGGTVIATDMYVLSILIFDGRDPSFPLDTTLTLDNGLPAVNSERVVDVAEFGDAGIGGGEVMLQSRPGRGNGDLEVKEGEWLMLSGYSETPPIPPATEPNRVGPIFLWYKVMATDEIDATASPSRRYVTLQGPDWPLFHTSGTSHTQATMMTGLISVYEKTIRLDSSSF